MAAAVEEEESAEAAADGEGDEAALKEMEVGGAEGAGPHGEGAGFCGRGGA